MRKLPGSVGGLNAKQDMLSSGGDVTSISYKGQETEQNLPHFKTVNWALITSTERVSRSCCDTRTHRAAQGADTPTFIGLWLSAVVLPNMLVPPVPNPDVDPNRLILALRTSKRLSPARPSSVPGASHRSHHTSTPLGGTQGYTDIPNKIK